MSCQQQGARYLVLFRMLQHFGCSQRLGILTSSLYRYMFIMLYKLSMKLITDQRTLFRNDFLFS